MEIETNDNSNSYNSTNSNDNDDNEVKDVDCTDTNAILWSINESTDTLFYAHGLINHSDVKGKIVFVAWNEKYLINFVFKTSQKTQQTSLTKVRLIMPRYTVDNDNNDKQIDDDQEEIKQITILKYNTLLLMHSGRIYYFSSVKTLRLVNCLRDVCCISSNSTSSSSSYPNTFSLIRFKLNPVTCEAKTKKQLCLEVYLDDDNFGKQIGNNNSPIYSYDITYDECNIFECHWEDDEYTILNLYVSKENIAFLNELANMGTNFLNVNANSIVLMENQNIQIFTISGNLFILIGDEFIHKVNNNSKIQDKHLSQDYQIQLLNCYTSNIKCVYYECSKQLLIVLLQYGYIDVWYKSQKCYDALLHKNIQVSSYLHYDYCANDTTFYFITNNQIVQLKISYNDSNNNDRKNDEDKAVDMDECIVNKRYTCIGSMIACTWVQQFKQLICLSSNNIFYRLTFEQNSGQLKNCSDCSTKQCENLNQLYVLTVRRIKELMQRSNVLKKLQQEPTLLHQQIEKEYQKQVIIAMANKSDILCKKFQARLEYSYHLPKAEYFHKNILLRQFNWFVEPEGVNEDDKVHHRMPYYILIYLKLEKPINNSTMETCTTTFWCLHIYDKRHSIWLNLPAYALVNDQELCFIATATTNGLNLNLKEPYLKVTTFLQHNSQYICINFDINVRKDQRTYNGLFTLKTYYILEGSIKRDLNDSLQTFSRDINVVQNNSNFKYTFPIENSKIFTEIIQSFNFRTKDLVVLENNIAESINFYFLGYYLITLNYHVSHRQFNLTSSCPNVLFYMKMHCVYIVQGSNVMVYTDGLEDSEKLTTYILKAQCDIQRLHDEFKRSKVSSLEQNFSRDSVACHNNNISSLRLENYKRAYSKLRTEFSEIIR